MRADRDERLTAAGNDTQGRHGTQTLLTAIAVLILAAGAYLMAPGDTSDEADSGSAEMPPASPARIEPPQPDPAEAIRAAPDIPEAIDAVEEAAEENLALVDSDMPEGPEAPPPAAPEPTPEELDGRLRQAIADEALTVMAPLDNAVNPPYLFDRGVSGADQLARGLVPRRTLNLPRPEGAFTVQREGQRYRVDPAGYARYDTLVQAITALPTETLASLFQRFRAELGTAYASLGYPEDAMDNTIIAALDAVIDAPVVDEAPLLRSKGALWAYADDRLESASDLHRQLLRTGPDNTRALQAWARRMRTALLSP